MSTTGHSRKSSRKVQASEEQAAFVVSAPGKVIVFGEHAVVHGKAAIAAAVSLRSYLLVTPSPGDHSNIALKFPDVGLDHTWPVNDLPWSAFAHSSKAKSYQDRVTSLDPELVEAIQPNVNDVSPDKPDHVRSVHRHAATTFLYLLLSLSTKDIAACTYVLRSTIPIGAGLGSSASISVCISAALLHQARRLELPSAQHRAAQTEQLLETINQWAFVGELCIHGTPSGVDNTVATRGKAVLFKRTGAGQPPHVTPLHDFPVLPLLLVNTNQARSTATEVAKVGALKTAHPAVVERLLDAIDNIAEDAHALIAGSFDPQDPHALQRLGELVRMNHGLLVALGVSHPKLERIREIVDHAGIGWTKLTGGGGGGCAITVLKQGSSGQELYALEQRLEDEGFAKYETLLGGNGVGILAPAAMDEGDITQDAFLQAERSGTIEELVGPESEQGKRRWRYWGK